MQQGSGDRAEVGDRAEDGGRADRERSDRWSATVEGDRSARRLTVRWQHPLSAVDVVGWDVAVGWEAWRLRWPHSGSEPSIVLPWRLLASPIECRVLVEVTARTADGATLGSARLVVVLPPFDPAPPSTSWSLGVPDVVVDDATRVAAGRTYWPDGTLGFAAGPDGTVRCWAPDGRVTLRADGAGPIPGPARDVLVGPHRIRDARERADYASGGPVIDVGDGVLAMVWHGEEYVGGDPDDFWGFLGLARSTDGGETFHDLGRIVTPHLRAGSPRRLVHVEVGGGSVAVADDGHVHVYYRDALDTGRSARASALSVARCRLADLVAAVHDGAAPELAKHHDGGWGQPGLGGLADDLLPGTSLPRWFDVIRHDDCGWLMVTSVGLAVDWAYVVRTSPDGLVWSDGERVGEPIHDVEALYVTLSGDDLSASRRARDGVWLWRTVSARSASARWDDARLERVRLTPRPRPPTDRRSSG